MYVKTYSINGNVKISFYIGLEGIERWDKEEADKEMISTSK